jgi:hypothetical protein
MMDKIKEHAEKHKKLYFIEALFPILAHTNNLTVSDDTEYFGHDHVNPAHISHNANDFSEQNKHWIYHPLKDTNTHVNWRKHIADNFT